MNARTRDTQLRGIRQAMDAWCAAWRTREPWLITLDGEEITILAPLGCAKDLQEQGYQIVVAPTEEVTVTELHRRSIHFYGHAIQHGNGEIWTRIDAVHLSPYDGIDIDLLGGGTLQSCSPDTTTFRVTTERI